MNIINTVVKRPVSVIMICLGVLLLGGISLSRLSVDLLPDLSYPKLTIRTTYPGAVPEEVERIVTEKIEQAVSMVHGLRRIHSVSREGVSIVTLEFAWGRDMDFASLHVREKLDQLGRTLPREAGSPVIIRLDPSSQPIMALSVTGENLVTLKEFARDVIKRRLEQINGVALAELVGGLEREIEVTIDRDKLETLGISIDEVAKSIHSANLDLPGGTILKGRYRYSLRTTGSFRKIKEIEDIVVARKNNSSFVYLKDIGRVRDWFKERESITLYNGKESIGILIQKEAGSNTVKVSKKVRKILTQLQKEYPKIPIVIAYDEAGFISKAVNNVLQAIILGGILAFLTLFFFLHDLRNPVSIAVVMPISIITTFTLLYFTGVSLNLMSLGGLALGIGMLVDSSIVVLENIFRHREEGMGARQAAITGTKQVAMAVTASTLTTIAVFLPVIYVQGVAGQLFRDQALTVTFALLTSLIASLTLLPVLASRFRSSGSELVYQDSGLSENKTLTRPNSIFGWIWYGPYAVFSRTGRILTKFLKFIIGKSRSFLRGLQRVFEIFTKPVFDFFDRVLMRMTGAYENLLVKVMDNKAKSLTILFLFFIVTFLIAMQLPRELMPKVDQGEFNIEVLLEPGASLSATKGVVLDIEKTMINEPGVKDIFSNIGRTHFQMGADIKQSGLNRASIRVRMKKGRAALPLMNKLRKELNARINARISYNSGETVLSQFLGSDQGDIRIQVAGNNLSELQKLAAEVVEKCRKIKSITDIRSDFESGRPEYRISIDRKAAGLYGLSVYEITHHIQNSVSGNLADQFKEFDRKIDIRVRPKLEQRNSIPKILDSIIKAPKGNVPLKDLVNVKMSLGPIELHRENQVETISVYANSQGSSLARTIRKVENAVSEIPVTGSYTITVGGAKEEMSRSYKSLMLAGLLALILVYMIMAAQFESLLHPLIILFSVPMAVTGTIWLLFITGQSLNVISLIGIVVLVGIAVNDAIVKIDFINQERSKGELIYNAVIEAGRKRFRPIVMTSVTTVFGLLPLAIGLGKGGELQRPLALAVIGGLFTSTILTLILIPVIYSLLESFREKRLSDKSRI